MCFSNGMQNFQTEGKRNIENNLPEVGNEK